MEVRNQQFLHLAIQLTDKYQVLQIIDLDNKAVHSVVTLKMVTEFPSNLRYSQLDIK